MKHNLNAKETVEQFLEYWKNNNWREMKNLLQLTWMSTHNREDKRSWKIWFKNFKIENAKIAEKDKKLYISDIGECMKDIKCILFLKDKKEYKINMRLICEKEPYKPDIAGKWGINPISLLRKA